jgi:TRAP-type C4-dicarboxylate transport system permease small subunit
MVITISESSAQIAFYAMIIFGLCTIYQAWQLCNIPVQPVGSIESPRNFITLKLFICFGLTAISFVVFQNNDTYNDQAY